LVRSSQSATLDATIDAIYGSIREPEVWASVLKNIDDITGSSCSVLHSPMSRNIPHYNTPTTIDVDRLMHYQNTLLSKDNVVPHVRAMAPGRVVSSTDFLGSEGARRSTVYREFYAECGFLHFLGANLLQTNDQWIGIVCFRGAEEGPYGANDRALLERIVPHLMRSTHIAQYILEREAATEVVMSGFDATHHAAFLLDPDGKTTTMNGLGRALIDRGDMGLSADQRLMFPSGAPLIGARVRGGLSDTSRTLHKRSGGKLAVSISKTASPPVHPACLKRTNKLVLAFDLDAHFSAIIEDIVREFGLTQAERRVYEASLYRSSSCEIAETLYLGRETVRTHLKSIFLKIGVSSHVDLVQDFVQRSHTHLDRRMN
jgi:DNA-binding CsgD family transcriptional regulator